VPPRSGLPLAMQKLDLFPGVARVASVAHVSVA
jgi:hypothetical protein